MKQQLFECSKKQWEAFLNKGCIQTRWFNQPGGREESNWGSRIIIKLQVAYRCEVEGVVCRDERHGIGSPLKPIDLLMRVSNQHLCTSLRLNDTDDSCMESNVKNNNWL